MCYVHVTALVAEYLTRKGKKWFCVLWNNCKVLQSSKDKREPFRRIWGGDLCVCVCLSVCLSVCVCVCVCVSVCVHPYTILLLFSHLVMLDSLQLHGACQAPLSMRFSRQEYRSGLPFASLGDLPNRGIKPSFLYCRRILYHCATWETIIRH